jgi:hypothetical protein
LGNLPSHTSTSANRVSRRSTPISKVPEAHLSLNCASFVVEMERNYSKQTMALTNARKEDVYKYEKAENLDRRFWCQLNQDFYFSMVLRKGKAPIVPCKYVDWAYFEKLNDPFFNQAIAKCKEFGCHTRLLRTKSNG